MASAGIPYFPLECQLNEKIQLLEAEYGLKGFAVVVKLYQRIYGSHGYYCEWTKDVELLFSVQLGEGRNFVSEIVQRAIERDIFSKPLYDKYHILTSEGIQRRYFEAVSRRKKVEVEEAYLLVPATKVPVNVDILGKNVDISSKNANIFKQRKEEERKEKKSKEEKRRETPQTNEGIPNHWMKLAVNGVAPPEAAKQRLGEKTWEKLKLIAEEVQEKKRGEGKKHEKNL